MTIDVKNLLDSIMESLDRIQYIKVDDIPNIDLYMDQVTTFMESKLRNTTRNPDEDKILTKTMINNYAKNNLLPPPVKKKYTREHILLLIFIYYYKGVLSINDIQTLLTPIENDFFGKEGDFGLTDIYEEVFTLLRPQVDKLKEDVLDKFNQSMKTFPKVDEKQEELQLFTFVGLLGFDVYVKKLLIEKMLDGYKEAQQEGKQDKK